MTIHQAINSWSIDGHESDTGFLSIWGWMWGIMGVFLSVPPGDRHSNGLTSLGVIHGVDLPEEKRPVAPVALKITQVDTSSSVRPG